MGCTTSSPVGVAPTIGNDMFSATFIQGTHCAIKDFSLIRFKIWKFEIYFHVCDGKIVNNDEMVYYVVCCQYYLKKPKIEMLMDIKNIYKYLYSTNVSPKIQELVSSILIMITDEIVRGERTIE